MPKHRLFLISLLFFVLTASAVAQVAPTATLAGTVFDPSGAVLPEVALTLTNLDTGLERTAASASDGKYLFTSVPVGLYRLQAAASGFSTFQQTGIRLNVNTPATVDVRMAIGSVSDQVTVTADAIMVNTQSGALSQVVQQRYLQELPLNGRNAATLIRMVPGVASGVGTTTAGYANSGDTIAISVNGSRGNEVNYRLDGATHMDNVTNLNAAYPNPDALQEFNVQTSNYSAQYGNFAGAVVNVVTRSGSNALHGSLFYFVRNGAMNARNFFAAQSDNLKRNQLGGAIGGPIVRNKLFYFASYQGTIVRNTSFTNTAYVPDAAQRRGDFSALGKTLTDPLTNRPFPNAVIPASRLLSISTKLLEKVPFSDLSSGLLRYARPDRYQNQQVLGKADYTLGRHQLSGSFFYVRFPDPGWDGGGTLLTVRIGQRQTTRNFKFQDVFTVRPNLVNTVVASGLMLDSFNLRTSPYSLASFGEVFYTLPPEQDRELELGVTGYSGWGSVNNSPPGQWIRRNVEVNDTLTWIAGRHTINLGGEYTPFTMFDSYTKYQQSGNFSFSGQITGNGIGDLLLGKVATFNQSAGKFKQTRGKQMSFFVEDSFRVRPRLTLTAGLRWDPYLPYHDLLGQVAGFREGNRSKRFLNAPPGAIFPGDPDFPQGGMNNDLNNIGPRFGFAFTPRSGNRTTVRPRRLRHLLRAPLPAPVQQLRRIRAVQPDHEPAGVDMQNPYVSAGIKSPFPPFAPMSLAPDSPFVFPMPYAWFDEHWGVGNSQAWNLTVEQQLTTDLLMRVAYVGNKGTHLQSFRERNAAVYRAGATVANTNARRPYAPYYASMKQLVDSGNSVYHSLQVTLEKRFSANFSLLAFYTFSKSIDDESNNAQFTFSNPHPTDLRFNRGVSDFDIPHNFRVTGVYALPRLQGRHAALRWALGGWTLTEILDLRAGLPFGLSSGRDNSFSGMGLDRADITGNPALPSNRSTAETLARYFDPTKASFNAVGTYGNSPRNFLRAPGSFNVDSAIQKAFALREKLQLQLRGEFFNTLNHANFGSPGANVSSSANFGVINGAGDPRILQIGAKLIF